jgi:hypothetical protein
LKPTRVAENIIAAEILPHVAYLIVDSWKKFMAAPKFLRRIALSTLNQ